MPQVCPEDPKKRLRVFADSPEAFFTEGLIEIERTRMKGLPVLNPRIAVRSAAWRRWGNDWIGIMVTPWAILAVCACGCREAWPETPAGRERILELPGGDFPFAAMEDPVLGRFLLLSLMSPLLEVDGQETADIIGKTAFDALFSAQSIPEDNEDASVWIPPAEEGSLRRVIPIRALPPKDIENTPRLTPHPAAGNKDKDAHAASEAPEARESFFAKPLSKPISRRSFLSAGAAPRRAQEETGSVDADQSVPEESR